jgi:serine/threonine protein kinase
VIWIYTIIVPFGFWWYTHAGATQLFNSSSLNLTWAKPSTTNSSQLVFSSFSGFEYGIIYSSAFVGLSNLWVVQKIIVIFDLLPARLFSVIVPFNAVTMICFFSFLWQYWLVRYLHNIDPNGTGVAESLPSAVSSLTFFTVQVVCQLLIGVLGASFALLWTIMRLDMGAREMFIWTVGLEKATNALQLEADPFNPLTLKHWLTTASSGESHSEIESQLTTRTTGSGTVISGMDDDGFGTDGIDNRLSDGAVSFWMLASSDITVQHRIAAGAGGCVFHGMYKNVTAVALKQVYSTRICEVDELAHEAALLGQLDHEHVVKFLGLCKMSCADAQGMPVVYIVQELCSSSLRTYMQTDLYDNSSSGTLTWIQEVMRLVSELCAGMAYLHSRNIVHRDLKPENILLSGINKTVRVTDFGISSQRSTSIASKLTTENMLRAAAGTLVYMAPETYIHLLNKTDTICEAKPLVDVYAFGVILWELLYDGLDAMDALASLHQYSKDLLTSLPCTGPALKHLWEWPSVDGCMRDESPDFLVQLLCRCLSFEAEQRPSFVQIRNMLFCEGAATPQRYKGKGKAERSISECTLHKGLELAYMPPKHTSSNYRTPLMDDIDNNIDNPNNNDSLVPNASAFTSNLYHDATLKFNPCVWTCGGSKSDLERRFDEYMHSDQFYSMLKWPYIGLAVLYLISAFVIIGVMIHERDDNYTDSIGPFYGHQYLLLGLPLGECGGCLLFGCVSIFAWTPRLRKNVNSWVLSASLLHGVLQAVSTLWNGFGSEQIPNSFVTLFLYPSDLKEDWFFVCNTIDNSSTSLANYSAELDAIFKQMDFNTSGQNACISLISMLRAQGGMYGILAYASFFFEVLTIPVIFIVLGLPFRLYLCAISIPFLAFVVKCCFLFASPYGSNVDYITVFILGLVMFASCIISVFRGEKSRRALFLMYCDLVSRKRDLSKDANFRRYRDILAAHRHCFVRTMSNEHESVGLNNGSHQITSKAVTIN